MSILCFLVLIWKEIFQQFPTYKHWYNKKAIGIVLSLETRYLNECSNISNNFLIGGFDFLGKKQFYLQIILSLPF